jgi:AcrR family transcriptional regulator
MMGGMHPEHVDPRTRRTVTALRNALLVLAESTPVTEIDVSALCRAAGVHRTTFYKHFATVSDLARCLVTGLLARIDDPAIAAERGLSGWLTAVLEQVAANRHTYRHILAGNGDPAVQRLLCERLAAATHAALVAATARGDDPDIHPGALAGALGYGCYGLVEAVLTDETLDIAHTVDAVVALLPAPLRPALAA